MTKFGTLRDLVGLIENNEKLGGQTPQGGGAGAPKLKVRGHFPPTSGLFWGAKKIIAVALDEV